MSDITTDPEPEPAPPPDPDLPPAADDVEPDDVEGWKAANAKLRSENQKYRERWQPVERALSGLTPEELGGVVGLANIIAAGDRPAAVAWLADSAIGVAGDDLADLLVERGWTPKAAKQMAADVAQKQDENAEESPKYLTVGEAEEVARRIAAEESAKQADMMTARAEADGAWHELDIDPESPYGLAVRDGVSRLLHSYEGRGLSISDAIKAVHERLEREATARVAKKAQTRAARPAGQVPSGAAPNGVARDNMTPQQISQARIDAIATRLSGGGDT